MTLDAQVNEMWAAARVYRLIEKESTERGLAKFEHELIVKFLDQASAAYIDKLATQSSGKSDLSERARFVRSLMADLERFRRL
jgi:hypothetical protein